MLLTLLSATLWSMFIMLVIRFWSQRRDKIRAHQFVRDCHGDLPPISSLRDKNHSAVFLGTLLPYYEGMDRVRRLPAPPETFPKAPGTFINPLGESDCPECANGVVHEKCRSGWREVLYVNALGNLNELPPWKSPCDTCGGNCGQCASSHCGICGVKPRDGECDLKQHAAFELRNR